jgi:hypothetical protein
MQNQNVDVKAGKLFCISRGEYSDYRYEGHFLALQDIDRATLQSVVDDCRAEHNRREESEDKYWGNVEDLFMPELIRRGLVMDIDVQEIHTGSYGDLSLS